MSGLLKIGISASILHRDPSRALFKNKVLLTLEESLAHWVQSAGALCLLVPTRAEQALWTLPQLVKELDGLLLQGGADLSPATYGESPLQPEWAGDSIRDTYEIDLVKECLAQDKPILGVCRGAQLINVAFGGTLYQDINTQVKNSFAHRDWERYDQNFHSIFLEPDSRLATLYPGLEKATVTSIHHQGVRDLGKNLVIEARSEDDGIVEAIRHSGAEYVFGVQWHPEFHSPKNPHLLSGRPIVEDFLQEAKKRRDKNKS